MATIASLVTAARIALEALADRLRRGQDATLETADACAALRSLADAWADVTPPEWPNTHVRCGPCSPSLFAALLEMWFQVSHAEEAFDEVARDCDAYADGLRAWGREAAACEEETEPPDTERPAAAPSLADVTARLLAGEVGET
jgi:hypothetical protein